MTQPSLFDRPDNGQARAGFRLHDLELLNWGTFHQRIWRLQPAGATTLLTGENGSGKSTLVDALLTLLVPNRKRNYNQAATTGRRERSELTYLRGAYGRLQSDEGYSARVQYLRDKESYAVILAHFHDKWSGEGVTLAQVFWLTDTVKKFHVVARRRLTITEHFSDFDTIRALKKQLRDMERVAVENQFSRYSRRLRKLFGLRSEKALDLFNQTVTIKEIGQLNDFVRQHMLEKSDVQTKIGQLQDHYENLMLAYQAMQTAEHKLALLRPLAAEARKYEAAQTEIENLRGCQEAIPIYFAGKKWQLLQTAISAARADVTTARAELNQLESRLTDLRQHDTQLQIAISHDETGRRLRELEQELTFVRQNEARKQDNAAQYEQVAAGLGLPAAPSEVVFAQNRQGAKAALAQLTEAQAEAAEALRASQIAENDARQAADEIKAELDSLRQRTSQIPARNLRLRAEILDALGLDAVEVPFVGELVKVRESESAWTGAVERLLHNFGLRLLVPARHYGVFAAYVNEYHLRGRIVFHRIPAGRRAAPAPDVDGRAVSRKLEIKPDSAYYDWLERELAARFDHTCCETLAEFDRAGRAVTRSGLIKSGGRDREYYEKDDRYAVDDRRRFILGWRNEEKIQALATELDEIEGGLTAVQKRIAAARRRQQALADQQLGWQNLLGFTTFAELDWRAETARGQDLAAQRERLQAASDGLRQLQAELAAVQAEMSQVEKARARQADTVSKLDYQLEQYQRELKEAQQYVSQAEDEAMLAYAPQIRAQVTVKVTIANVDRLWLEVNEHFHKAIDSEQRRANSHSGRLLKMMQEYKDAYRAETVDFDADVGAIPEFDRELARIEHDDLPQYSQRFKGLLNEKVIEAIALLQADLYKNVEEIEENISDLNQSLRTINYTPDTYIQLQTEANRDPEIREFKAALKACLADVGRARTAAAYEASFQQVRVLITRFKEEPRWMLKVTDVRHWLDFAAVERYRADDAEKHYYSDSSGKSGGQKAKLAYTILASAIAFQFGLERGSLESGSFRFVVVDEAFSRSDENNSRYAMQLFQELDLQLLVVTPMTGIHIVEPYIDACHFVWNNTEGNYSQVHTMTIDAFQTERAQFQTAAETAVGEASR